MNVSNNYDDDYFVDKQLVVIYHTFASGYGENNFKINKIYSKNSKIYIDLWLYSKGLSTVISSYIVYIEIDKTNDSQIVLTKTNKLFD